MFQHTLVNMIKEGDIFCCIKQHSCGRFQWNIGDSIKILVNITGVILDLNERNYDCKIIINGKEYRVTKTDSEILCDRFITIAEWRDRQINSILE